MSPPTCWAPGQHSHGQLSFADKFLRGAAAAEPLNRVYPYSPLGEQGFPTSWPSVFTQWFFPAALGEAKPRGSPSLFATCYHSEFVIHSWHRNSATAGIKRTCWVVKYVFLCDGGLPVKRMLRLAKSTGQFMPVFISYGGTVINAWH